MGTVSLKRNFILNFILTATNLIFPLVTFPYVSRVLGVAGTGTVSFVTSVVSYFTLVANLGIPMYGIRACAKVRDNKEELTKTVHELFIINSIMTVLSLALFILSIYLVPQFREEKTLFYINAIGLLLNLFGINWLYQALEQYDYITIRSIAFKILSIVLMFLMVKKESDYIVYGGISLVASVGSNIFNALRARRFISFKPRRKYNIAMHIKPILVLFAQTVVVSVYVNLDTIMLGFMKGNEQVGLYNAATKVRTILVSLVTSVAVVLLPRMTKAFSDKDSNQMNSLAELALNSTLLLAIPLSIFFCLFSKPSIHLLAGGDYLGGVRAMQFITIAVVPIGITGVLGTQVLTAQEKERKVLYSVIVGAVVDLLLNLLLIPRYGATGAALATMVAEFCVLAMQVWYTRGLLKCIFPKLRVIYYLLGAILGGGLSLLVNALVGTTSSFLVLLISATVFFGAFLIMMFLCKDPIIMQILKTIKVKLKKDVNK